MERGLAAGDPTRGDLARPARPPRPPARPPARGAARAATSWRDSLADVRQELDEIVDAGAGRRPAAARRARADAASRAGRRRRGGRGRRPDDGPTRRPTPSCERMLRDVAAKRLDSSTRCRPTSAPDPRGSRTTTSWTGDARERFETLVERLREQMLDRCVDGPGRRDQGDDARRTSPRNREMVRDLNQLLARADRAASRPPDVDEFLAKHGQFFPGAQTLDDVIEQLAERMAAMQSLLRSLTPGAARRAPGHDGRAAARRPAALGPRPAGREPRPAAARRAGRARAVQRRRAAGARGRAGPDRPAPGARPAGGRSSTASSAPGDLGRHRPRRGRATCSATTPPATSTRSTTWRAGSSEAGYLDPRRRAPGADAAGQPADRPEGARRPVRAARSATRSAAIGSTGPGAAASARRRPSRTSSATRSTSTCGRTMANALTREENAPAPRAAPARRPPRRPTTSRCSGPSSRPGPRPCCSST